VSCAEGSIHGTGTAHLAEPAGQPAQHLSTTQPEQQWKARKAFANKTPSHPQASFWKDHLTLLPPSLRSFRFLIATVQLWWHQYISDTHPSSTHTNNNSIRLCPLEKC
jgi:hypothetical protein